MQGKVIGISGPTVTVDLPDLTLYERVSVGNDKLQGEVVRLRPASAVVQVYEETKGLRVGEPAVRENSPLTVRFTPGLLGGIFDGLQRPLQRLGEEFGPFIRPGDMLPFVPCEQQYPFVAEKKAGDRVGQGEYIGYVEEGAFRHYIAASAEGVIREIRDGNICPEDRVAILEDGTEALLWHQWPIRTARPFTRKKFPRSLLVTGQRCIDFLFPLAFGGTAVMPGGFGTGKTILEQAVAKYADVDIVVYVGCGERGNEMAEMLEEFRSLADPWTGRSLLDRTILVANTSNMPVAAREASIYTAVSMAEYYRDMGYHVLLLADSISRWAEALREISSALEEMPGEEGYPTYLASRLSGFMSRAGVVETLNGKTGSLSMVLSVSPPGGDFTEPTTQACLRNTGAFLMLDTDLAHRRHFPAINWAQSFSLYDRDVAEYCAREISPKWPEVKKRCQALLKQEEQLREVAEIVGDEGLQDADRLLMHVAEQIRSRFLCQNSFTDDAFSGPQSTFELIEKLVAMYDRCLERIRQGESLGEILLEEHP
ncbi:MAG: V-type ATP synthase subunit A [Desulfobulbaceae bacterium]|nr:V-type ATP synthase subunit A [Desulfobulbaceae bacterium]